MMEPRIPPEAVQTIRHIRERWKNQNVSVLRHAFPLLAEGRPVSPEELAGAAGLGLAEVETLLRDSRAELDPEGRIEELFGIMFAHTPHRIEAGGAVLHACCPLVAQAFAGLSGREITIISADPISRQTVRLTVGPASLEGVEPAAAVGSMARTTLDGVMDSVSENFCRHIHVFASRGTAQEFIVQDPRRYLVGMSEFHEISQKLLELVWRRP